MHWVSDLVHEDMDLLKKENRLFEEDGLLFEEATFLSKQDDLRIEEEKILDEHVIVLCKCTKEDAAPNPWVQRRARCQTVDQAAQWKWKRWMRPR